MPVPRRLIMHPLNDQVVELLGMQDALTSQYFNSATVTATLKTRQGVAIDGCNALPLSYVASSNGDYRGQVQETFNPRVGGYFMHYDFNQAGTVVHLEVRTSVRVRRS